MDQIKFTKSGMRQFKTLNDAVKHFTSLKQPRSIKSIVWLWQESFEINVGNVSILCFDYKTDPKSFELRVKSLLKSQSQIESFKKTFQRWLDETNGIYRISDRDVKTILKETDLNP